MFDYFSLFQIKVVILPIRMNLQKQTAIYRFDYFVFFYPRATVMAQTALFEGEGRGKKLKHFPEASVWGVFVPRFRPEEFSSIYFTSSFPKFPEVVSRGFPK